MIQEFEHKTLVKLLENSLNDGTITEAEWVIALVAAAGVMLPRKDPEPETALDALTEQVLECFEYPAESGFLHADMNGRPTEDMDEIAHRIWEDHAAEEDVFLPIAKAAIREFRQLEANRHFTRIPAHGQIVGMMKALSKIPGLENCLADDAEEEPLHEFEVTLRATELYHVKVTARNEEDAKDAALDKWMAGDVDFDFPDNSDIEAANIEQIG